MKHITRAALLGGVLTLFASIGTAERLNLPASAILFKNVKIFDGVNDTLSDSDLLVVRNRIHRVGTDIPETGTWKIEAQARKATRLPAASGDFSGGYIFRVPGADNGDKTIEIAVQVIDGGGRTLMPGLIDAHTHFNHCLPGAGVEGMENTHWSEIGSMATVCAKEHLMNGFTTVREMGAGTNGYGLKKAIDGGYVEGPRIYPSGGYISQTSGHGDFMAVSAQTQEETNLHRLGVTVIADGPDEVRAAVRKQLSLGASQIKIMGGGGVSSLKDPLHSSQYTMEEMQAAVEAAEQFDTYVAAHLYQDVDIRRALEAGILSIEHGQHISDETARIMIEKGAYHVLNAAGLSPDLFLHPVYGAEGTPPYIKSKQQHELSKKLPEVQG